MKFEHMHVYIYMYIDMYMFKLPLSLHESVYTFMERKQTRVRLHGEKTHREGEIRKKDLERGGERPPENKRTCTDI